MIATDILTSLKRREIDVFNPIFLAGVYLDNGGSVDLLTDEQKASAKSAIVALSLKMKGISANDEDSDDSMSDELSSVGIESDCESDEDVLMLRRKEKQQRRAPLSSGFDYSTPRKRNKSGAERAREDIAEGLKKLEELRTNSIIKKKTDVWKAIEEQYPESIKSVSRLILAMPPSQVSVERLFSSLKILKSERRNRLKADLLDAMLFLRSNKGFDPK